MAKIYLSIAGRNPIVFTFTHVNTVNVHERLIFRYLNFSPY
ncbi:MAG: hypothetical protein JWR38_2011 [Mucilaginibacter sp.]|nr:hypothetical protein [Mucilaginibacter sp.]